VEHDIWKKEKNLENVRKAVAELKGEWPLSSYSNSNCPFGLNYYVLSL